jgi:hypothetical protein
MATMRATGMKLQKEAWESSLRHRLIQDQNNNRFVIKFKKALDERLFS